MRVVIEEHECLAYVFIGRFPLPNSDLKMVACIENIKMAVCIGSVKSFIGSLNLYIKQREAQSSIRTISPFFGFVFSMKILYE